MRCLVLVGLIGSGKTTLAEGLPGGWLHKSFDREWHEWVQAEGGVPADTVARIASRLKCPPEQDVVIDGWWTWDPEWWLTDWDPTLEALQDIIPHEIVVCHLSMPLPAALAAFKLKHATGQYDGTILEDAQAYAASLPARHEYLSRKVDEWAR